MSTWTPRRRKPSDLEELLNLDPQAVEEGLREFLTPDPEADGPPEWARILANTRRATRRRYAEALRAIQKLARQIAEGGPLWLLLPELQLVNAFLRSPFEWEFVAHGPRHGDEYAALLTHFPRRRARPFETILGNAARAVVALGWDGPPDKLAVCRAPKRPANLEDTETCGRLFVNEAGGQPRLYCGATCRKYAKRREEALKLGFTRARGRPRKVSR